MTFCARTATTLPTISRPRRKLRKRHPKTPMSMELIILDNIQVTDQYGETYRVSHRYIIHKICAEEVPR